MKKILNLFAIALCIFAVNTVVAQSCSKTCPKKAAALKAAQKNGGAAVLQTSLKGANTPTGKTCNKSKAACAKSKAQNVQAIKASLNTGGEKKACNKSKAACAKAKAAQAKNTNGVKVMQASLKGDATAKTCPKTKQACAKAKAAGCCKKGTATAKANGATAVQASLKGATKCANSKAACCKKMANGTKCSKADKACCKKGTATKKAELKANTNTNVKVLKTSLKN